MFSELVNSRVMWPISTGLNATISMMITAPQTRRSGARWASDRVGGGGASIVVVVIGWRSSRGGRSGAALGGRGANLVEGGLRLGDLLGVARAARGGQRLGGLHFADRIEVAVVGRAEAAVGEPLQHLALLLGHGVRARAVGQEELPDLLLQRRIEV